MKKYFQLLIGIVCFLGISGSNVFAQSQSGQNDVFEPIKNQMTSIAERNSTLAKQNRTLRVQLIGLQLEIEKQEKVIKDLDPGYTKNVERSRKEDGLSSVERMNMEGSEGFTLIEEAQEIFLSGQYIDLGGEQKLRELQLYDLQYQKQELELDFQDRQDMAQGVGRQRRQELQIVEREARESAKAEESIRSEVAEAERKAAAYLQNIDLLKMENETLKKKISHLRKMLSR